MKKNTQVETAQKSQATNKIQPKNVQKDLAKIREIRDAKKNNTPTGKVTLMKETELRKKLREEQYRNFRISALRRRCKRMNFTEEETEEFVKKLIEQMNAPKDYDIIVMVNQEDSKMFDESMAKEKINYNYKSEPNTKKGYLGFVNITGNNKILDKIREIAPPGAKIYVHAKKAESVLPKADKDVIKKPTNNTAEKKTAAKVNKKIFRGSKGVKYRQAGRTSLADIRRASRYVKKNLKKGEKIDIKKVFKVVEERAKGGAATTVLFNAKKSSTGSKKASTDVKKAA